jgi:hypothetical protein
MRGPPLSFTAEKAIPVAQPAPNLANVVPFNRRFNRRVRLPAKFEPVTSTNEERSPKTVTPLLSGATEGSAWPGPDGVIIDFPHGNRHGHAPQEHDYLSGEDRVGLTAMDGAVIAYVVLSTAFYPAVAWLFSS